MPGQTFAAKEATRSSRGGRPDYFEAEPEEGEPENQGSMDDGRPRSNRGRLGIARRRTAARKNR